MGHRATTAPAAADRRGCRHQCGPGRAWDSRVYWPSASGSSPSKAFSTPAERTEFAERGHYTQASSFDYTFALQPSTLYPTGLVAVALPALNADPGLNAPVIGKVEVPPFYTKLVRGVEVGFFYSLTGTEVAPQSGAGALNLTVKAAGEGGWSKSFEIVAPTGFAGTSTSMRSFIELAPLQALIESIEKETGFSAPSYDFTVSARVDTKATVAGEAVKLLYTPAITFKYTKTLITPDPQLQQTQPTRLGENVTKSRDLSLGLVSLPVSTLRPLAAALAAVAAGDGRAVRGGSVPRPRPERNGEGAGALPHHDGQREGRRPQRLAARARRDDRGPGAPRSARRRRHLRPEAP